MAYTFLEENSLDFVDKTDGRGIVVGWVGDIDRDDSQLCVSKGEVKSGQHASLGDIRLVVGRTIM